MRAIKRAQRNRALRVVLDTNVLVSALVFGKGPTATLRAAWQRGDFLPLVSKATVQELVRVLAYPKFRLDTEAQTELLADYLPHTTVVQVPTPPPAVPACRDAFNLPFLHLASAGKADVLVTGDADLLILAKQVTYRLLPLDAFLESLSISRT